MRNCSIDEFYIWRTQQDAKVRSGHAEREGKVYSIHNPPPDGPPGTAPNCRCWKERPTLREIRSGEVPCYYNKLKIERIAVRDKLATLQNEISGIIAEANVLSQDIETLEQVLATISDPDFPFYIPTIPIGPWYAAFEIMAAAKFAYDVAEYQVATEVKAGLRKDIAAKKARLRAILPKVDAAKKEINSLVNELHRITESMAPCRDCQFAR